MHCRLAPLLLAALLGACGAGTSAIDTAAALQRAEELRDGCVADHLRVLLLLADFLAPLVAVDDRDELAEFADVAGCELTLDAFDGAPFTLTCRDVPLDGDLLTIEVELTFLDDGAPTPDIDAADSLDFFVRAAGTFSTTEATLEIELDPEAGIAVAGRITTDVPGDCDVAGRLENVTGRLIADLPGLPVGFVFTSGNVDLAVEEATGTAGLVGRSAVVLIVVDGVFADGDVLLGR